MRLPRRLLLGAVLIGAVPVRSQAASDAVDAPIRAFYTDLEAQMRLGRATPFKQRFDALTPAVERLFDLDTILRVSVGLRWSTLDATTQAALERAFRRFTVATYVANFDVYEGEKFEVLPERRTSGADQIVASRIVDRNGESTRLDYVMHQTAAGWQAIDVLLEGTISRVAVQRSDFRSLVAPGDASALLRSLQKKIADLSGGALTS
jgi:phospholipid transport system substrate-binding protein